MYLKYGSYSHQLDEAAVSISKSRNFSKQGLMVGYNETWRITGKIVGTDVSDLTSKLYALEAAYNKTDQDIYLLTDAGGSTAHRLISAETASGVKPISFSYPEGNGAEYTTYRTYEIIVEAKMDADEGNSDNGNLISYNQQISVSGTGGPQFVIRTPRYGQPVYQQVSRASPISVSQSGSSIGNKYYPAPESPIYPQYLHPESHAITRHSPKDETREGKRNFEINWSYNFTLVK